MIGVDTQPTPPGAQALRLWSFIKQKNIISKHFMEENNLIGLLLIGPNHNCQGNRF